MKQWRQELHSNPELKFDCYETAEFIVKRLKEFGISEIHTGIAKTGIVAIINGKKEGETIGLRAEHGCFCHYKKLNSIHTNQKKMV
jgi:Metal-dependent amidase/aminoacylase/carboxypeptidase